MSAPRSPRAAAADGAPRGGADGARKGGGGMLRTGSPRRGRADGGVALRAGWVGGGGGTRFDTAAVTSLLVQASRRARRPAARAAAQPARLPRMHCGRSTVGPFRRAPGEWARPGITHPPPSSRAGDAPAGFPVRPRALNTKCADENARARWRCTRGGWGSVGGAGCAERRLRSAVKIVVESRRSPPNSRGIRKNKLTHAANKCTHDSDMVKSSGHASPPG